MTVNQKPANPYQDACKLCGETVEHVFSARVLGKYEVGYFQCNHCGLMQTEEPYWLGEAYGEAISSADTGIMARNLYVMKVVAVFLKLLGGRGRYLDYGGGHGVFTRLMRDHGFDFYWSDAYAKNLFARGFSYQKGALVEGVTAFELLEHLDEPKRFFRDVLGQMKPEYLIASTELFSGDANPEWKYLYCMTGQHIAFYQEKTLEMIALEYGYYYSHFHGMHYFTKERIGNVRIKLIMKSSRFLYPFLKFPSLVMSDHDFLAQKLETQHHE